MGTKASEKAERAIVIDNLIVEHKRIAKEIEAFGIKIEEVKKGLGI